MAAPLRDAASMTRAMICRCHEWPRGVVHQHHLRVVRHDSQASRNRVLPPRTARHHVEQFGGGGPLGQRPRRRQILVGHDHDDAAHERRGGASRDAALEDRAVAKLQPLLGHRPAEATPPASGSDDHVDNHESISIRVVR